MYKFIKYSLIVIVSILIGTNGNSILAQNSKKLLQRDSLDYTVHALNPNTKNNEFNPIVYKGGLLFVSNKKEASNSNGANKIYWVPNSKIYNNGKDSAFKSIRLNDEFTAPTSNDNDILTHYSSKKYRSHLNNIESLFADFNPDGAFTINDSANEIFYSQLSSRKIKGAYRWELWHAYLKDGRIRQAKKIFTEKDTTNYIYPHLTDSGRLLLFSSNKIGGKGGYDIYAIEKKNNVWDTNPIALNEINTSFNEIAPTTINNKLNEIYYSSDKTGGMGGYDAYKYNRNSNLNSNLGFPMNTFNDELGIASIGNVFFLTKVVTGKPDVNFFEYNPINVNVKGKLTYSFDTSLAVNQKLYIIDKDELKIIDSVITDEQANFSFAGKPNRSYLIKTFNKDGYNESFEINTEATKVKDYYKNLALAGRSDKQIKDSIQSLIALAEQNKLDSLQRILTNNKFIVYYDFDKYDLQLREQRVLDSALVALKNNPSVYAVVGAFTDCIGSYEYNYNLSVKRAKAVVEYLLKHGLNKNRIVTNGYSKKYNVTPCLTGNTKGKKQLQQNNRRAEVVFSDTKATQWAELESLRGAGFYTVRTKLNLDKLGTLITPNNVTNLVANDSAKHLNVVPLVNKKSTLINTAASKITKDTIVVQAIKPVVKKETVFKNANQFPKKDSLASIVNQIAKKDTVVKTIKPVVKKDTVVKSVKSIVKKDTVVKLSKSVIIKDTSYTATVNANLKKRKDSVKQKNSSVIIAKASELEADEELSKEEIVKALDSLAKLKREQERIVDYLTKRINKKPILVFVNSDSIKVELYDNAIHDKDSVSVIYNSRIIVDRQELKVNQPIKFNLKVDKNKKHNELIMVAENLGAEPPNTAVMFITEKSGKRQQVLLSTDMTHNEVVYFINISKQ